MLKRTCTPFFGKAESHAARAATAAFQRGDTDGANRIYDAINVSRGRRYNAHLARGGRKLVRSRVR